MGVNFTLNHLRGKYSVVQGRQQVKRSIKECAECSRRFRGYPAQRQMTPLPRVRLEMTRRPFANCTTKLRRTFLHNARTRQTTDEALLMPICVFTDTLLPPRNGHFPGDGCILKCADTYGGSTRVA